jgi:uncharacterized membrane protein
MRPIIAAAITLALSGCQTAAPPVASPDLDLRGTEPFWALQVRGGELRLLRPEQPEMRASASLTRAGATLTWSGRTSDGRSLIAQVQPSDCSDGMSDLRYPMAAEVRLGTEPPLRGCALPAQLSRAPAPGS